MSTRRVFIGEAFAGLAGMAMPPAQAGQGAPVQLPIFHTALCDLLGIQYPVLQAPMQTIASPGLVAAVSEAGGLGILGGIGLTPDELRRQILEIRSLTKRPFGVNLILHAALRSPVDPASISDETVRGVQAVLNRFRGRLGLPSRTGPPPQLPADGLTAVFRVIVEERVPLFSTGLGLPTADMVTTCHQAGIKVMSMVAVVADALEAEKLGVDVIVAQGAEAGGHRSMGVKPQTPESAAIGTMVIVPQIAKAVRVPTVAAGGISDGRGLAAAVMLGAAGVLMGTRFIATAEATAPSFHKQALVAADSDQTTVSDAFTGHYARFLRNDYIESYRTSGAPVFPAVLQQLASRDIVEAALEQQVAALYPMYAGQGVGMIDTIPRAAEIVRSVIAEAREALESAPSRVRVTA